MATAQVSTGITIDYDVQGSGEDLLLVMGLGAQRVAWTDRVVDGLVDRGFRVTAFDNRDVGCSSKVDAPAPTKRRAAAGVVARRFAGASYLLTDMARDAIGLLDVLGIEQTHVVGASMGGMIAQTMAIEHRARVRSLTSIMSTTGDRRVGRPKAALLAKIARLIDGPRETWVERQVEIYRLISGTSFDADQAWATAQLELERDYCPEGTARQSAAIAASADRTPALRSLDLPALVVHGLQDPLVTPSGGVATARAIDGSRLLAFPDMGHNLPANRLDETLDAIARTAAPAR